MRDRSRELTPFQRWMVQRRRWIRLFLAAAMVLSSVAVVLVLLNDGFDVRRLLPALVAFALALNTLRILAGLAAFSDQGEAERPQRSAGD